MTLVFIFCNEWRSVYSRRKPPSPSLLSRSLSASCLSPRRFIDIHYIKLGVSSWKCFVKGAFVIIPGGKSDQHPREFTPVFHSCLVAECLLPEVLRIPCKHITILMAVRWKSAWLFVWENLNSSFQISKGWVAICSSIFVLSPSQPHAKTRMFYYHLLVLVIRFFNLPFPLLLPFALSESVELTETELFQCLKEKLDITAMRHSLTAY